MTAQHSWKVGGVRNAYVYHINHNGEQVLGPFPSERTIARVGRLYTMAEVVASALDAAYAAGKREVSEDLERTTAQLGKVQEAAAEVVALMEIIGEADNALEHLLGSLVPDEMLAEARTDVSGDDADDLYSSLPEYTSGTQDGTGSRS